LKTIEKHARNCKTILDDLLKFARSTPTKKSSVDINECLSEVISLLAHQFELEKVSLQTVMEPGLPRLVADGEKVKQVFMNLLMNAKQAITNTGNIVVQTKKDRMDSSVEVAITDDGCGIAPEHLHKIFDPFFTTKPVGEGTGLGLSVSYGIIQDHGGRIEVSSEPGKGSTFSVFLPLDEAVFAETGGKMASDRGSL
jgi:signal transduction histidine kinase